MTSSPGGNPSLAPQKTDNNLWSDLTNSRAPCSDRDGVTHDSDNVSHWSSTGEVIYGRINRYGHSSQEMTHPEEKQCATPSEFSPATVPSNKHFGTVSPFSLEKTSRAPSPHSYVAANSPVLTHPPDALADTRSGIESAHLSRRSLLRRTDRRSQRTAQSLPPPLPPGNSHTRKVTKPETYLLKVCRALMMYGAPTHRLEEYMQRTAAALGLPLQSFYMPGCMIISFNDTDWRSTEVHIVRCTQALNLAKLYDVHAVYRDIIHNRITVEDATVRLEEILTRSSQYPRWFLVLMYGLASASIGPVSYGARPIDLPVIFLLGSLLGFMDLILADSSELYAHIFEISSTVLVSFLARAFGSIHYAPGRTFCFSAICQASLVLILPGFTVMNSVLELQSKNIVSGSVRMVYGVIFTLFLAFGITIGSTLYGALDTNATSATKCDTTWPFWWQVIFVAPFTLCYIIINQGRWRKTPVMVILSLTGWLVNHFSAQYFTTNAQIAQALGALTVGTLANLYSRLGHGLAVALLHPAIFIQVPGSLAASGSLISGLKNADQLTNRNTTTGIETAGIPDRQANTAALDAGYAMIEIAIGITVGLSVSALVVYPFQKRRGKSGLFSF